MGINNLNPRRVVWFSPNEPSNKYDIWLSRNAHLDENGELTTDSNSQRDCDYIFKIYDCGKWNPIVGFNSTAANKIDCVENNTLYHPAIFTGQNPNDISDNGSLGELLADSHYVNEQEWEDIFNTDQFQQAFNTQVIDGDNYNWGDLIETTVQELLDDGEITIPSDQVEWRRATTSLLGGIKASVFRSIIPQEEIAEACFNDNLVDQTQNNDRLYIWAKDMMQAIQAYTEDHSDDSDFPYIVPPYVIPEQDVPNLLWDWFENSSTVLKGWQQSTGQAVANKPRFVIAGSCTAANRGKLLKLRDPDDPFWQTSEYTELNNAIEWVDPSELSTYTLEVASTSALGGIKAATHASAMLPESQVAECKFYNPSSLSQNSYKRQALCIDIKDVKNALDAWYASEDSDEWDVNLKASYGIVARKQEFIDDDNNTVISYTHSLSNYGQYTKEGMYCRTKFYNTSSQQQGNRDYSYNDGHGLEWVSGSDIIKDSTGYPTQAPNDKKYLACTAGVFSWEDEPSGGGSTGIDSLNETNYTYQGDYTISVPRGGTGGNNYFLNGKGGWTPITIPTYTNFIGATQSQNGQNGFVPAPTAGQQNYVLTGLKNNAWRPVTDVFSINTQNSVITVNGNFTLNDNVLSADYAGDSTDLGTLYPWNYYIISCNKSNVQFNFVISSARSDAGNPIYIRINTDAPMTLSGNIDYINSNDVFTTGTTLAEGSSYLLTIQFEIVKIEKIASTKQSSGNSEEQLSGNGGN